MTTDKAGSWGRQVPTSPKRNASREGSQEPAKRVKPAAPGGTAPAATAPSAASSKKQTTSSSSSATLGGGAAASSSSAPTAPEAGPGAVPLLPVASSDAGGQDEHDSVAETVDYGDDVEDDISDLYAKSDDALHLLHAMWSTESGMLRLASDDLPNAAELEALQRAAPGACHYAGGYPQIYRMFQVMFPPEGTLSICAVSTLLKCKTKFLLDSCRHLVH